MKTYRHQARDRKGTTRPEMIVPVTAHAAFDKASQYLIESSEINGQPGVTQVMLEADIV